MSSNVSGQSGFELAEVTVYIAPTLYSGGGLAGWNGGTAVSFRFKMRKPTHDRPRVNTTDGPVKSAVSGPTSVQFSGEGFYKGAGYPPVELATQEYVRVVCDTIWEFDMVLQVSKFEATGDAEDAVKFTLEGETDGIYSINGTEFGA